MANPQPFTVSPSDSFDIEAPDVPTPAHTDSANNAFSIHLQTYFLTQVMFQQVQSMPLALIQSYLAMINPPLPIILLLGNPRWLCPHLEFWI